MKPAERFALREELSGKINDLLREYRAAVGPMKCTTHPDDTCRHDTDCDLEQVDSILAASVTAVEYVITNDDNGYYVGYVVPLGQLASTSRGLAAMASLQWNG